RPDEVAEAIEIPAGSYWVVAWVGDEAKRQRRSCYAPLEFALALAPGETRTMPLAYTLGGLVRVDARTNDKERQRVQFRLLDARGEARPSCSRSTTRRVAGAGRTGPSCPGRSTKRRAVCRPASTSSCCGTTTSPSSAFRCTWSRARPLMSR